MPRARKAARAYRSPRFSVEQRVQETSASPWTKVVLSDVSFFETFKTPEERAAFRDLQSAWFFVLFGFVEHPSDLRADSIRYGFPFRRAAGFFEAKFPVPFEPIDLRGIPFRERELVLARARGAWWRVTALPMRADEIRWMVTHAA